MNSKERIKAAIERRPLDRIPRYDSFWEDTLALYKLQGLVLSETRSITIDGLTRDINDPVGDAFCFDIDALYVDISMRFPAKVLEESSEFIVVEDRCGYTAKKFKDRASSMTFLDHKIKTKDDWKKFRDHMHFDPNDFSRVDKTGYFLRTEKYPTWKGLKTLFDEVRLRNKYLMVVGYGPLEAVWRSHGFENTLADMVLDTEMMSDMFNQAATLLIDTIRYMDDNGMKPDGVWICEDMGGTHSLLFSPDLYDSLLFPCHQRIAEFLHSRGIHLIMHSCGRVEPLIPKLIEAGVDVLQAIQANTGMDIVELKEKYGNEITFFGNISEHAFMLGKQALEAELMRKIPVAMENGGYIYHSDHSIPPEVELETYRYGMSILDKIGVY